MTLKFVLVLACMVLVVIGGSPPATAETLYAVDAQSRLLTIDSLTATATVVGNLGFALTCFGGACFAGLDFNPADGKLYVSDSNASNLYTVDLTTGAATFVTAVTPVDGPGGAILQNFAFSPLGVLYGSEHFNLYVIDVTTGAAHFVGTDFSADDDALAFAADGTLFAVDGVSAFYRIDPTTGTKAVISGTPCWLNLTLAHDGQLYCADAGQQANLWRIDPATGGATLVGNTGVEIAGLATPPPSTPNPGQGPTSPEQCKKGGWQTFTNPSFKNQGQCVSFVVSQRGGR